MTSTTAHDFIKMRYDKVSKMICVSGYGIADFGKTKEKALRNFIKELALMSEHRIEETRAATIAECEHRHKTHWMMINKRLVEDIKMQTAQEIFKELDKSLHFVGETPFLTISFSEYSALKKKFLGDSPQVEFVNSETVGPVDTRKGFVGLVDGKYVDTRKGEAA